MTTHRPGFAPGLDLTEQYASRDANTEPLGTAAKSIATKAVSWKVGLSGGLKTLALLVATVVLTVFAVPVAAQVLQGTVRDRNTSTPLPGVTVNSSGSSTMTDGNGQYTFTAAQLGNNTSGFISFHNDGYFSTGVSYDLNTSNTADASLLPAIVLMRGTVRDANTHGPIAGATVNSGLPQCCTHFTATTDLAGNYVIDTSGAGEGILAFLEAGYTAVISVQSAAYFNYVSPDFQAGPEFPVIQDVNLVPAVGIALQGTVTDRNTSMPLSGVTVRSSGSSTATDGNGQYSFTAGQLSNNATGFISFQKDRYFSTGVNYDLNAANTADATLLPAIVLMQGTVRDANTHGPIAGATVNSGLPQCCTHFTATTDLAGNYVIDTSGAGEGILAFLEAGYTAAISVQSAAYFNYVSPDFQAGPEFPALQDAQLTPTGLTSSITVSTLPAGLGIAVNGLAYASPQSFTWVPGNPHAIATTTPQPGAAGTRYAFSNWNNGGPISQTVVTPAANATYTAEFKTQYGLTTNVAPDTGSITGGGWFDSGANVSIQASANAGYQFAGFSGDLTGVTSPQTLTMDSPKSVTANFSPIIASGAGVQLSSTSVTFPDQPVGTTSPSQAVILTNAGGVALTISSIGVSGDFGFATTGSSCPYSGGLVSPGATCTIDLTFSPSQAGTRSGAVSIVDNASDSPQALNLSGKGVTSVAPSAGLQGWWPGESNFNDIRGPNSGTNPGGVTFVAGEVGQAFHFDGSANSYFTVPNTATFAPTTNRVTIAAWIRPDFTSANSQDTVFSKRDNCGPNRSYLLSVSKAGLVPLGYPLGSIYWSASVASDDAFTSGGFPNDGQFHFLAGTYDGASMTVYLDGVAVAQKAHSGPIPVTSEPAYIGVQGSCGDLTVADLDEIQFYDRALSQTEIAAIYNAGNAGVSQRSPVPQINQPLIPGSVPPGGSSFTLTLDGSGFVPGAAVNWNGSALDTTFVSKGRLTATVPAANTATASTASITVVNPGPVASDVVSLEITNPGSTLAFKAENLGLVGVLPWNIITGDFNGDGKPDLAFANSGDNAISVLPGNGDGTFGAQANSLTEFVATSITAGDFNGDGKLDLAVAKSNTNTVAILVGHGDGHFAAPVNYAVGQNPKFVAAGDFNADGRLDLAVANQNSNTVSVLPGSGDGTFGTAIDYPTGSAPSFVVTGDLNLDGILDLVVANQNSATVSILLGIGDGSFATAVDFATGTSSVQIGLADLNGDGILDLAVAGGSTLSILVGNGDGTFASHVDYPAPSNVQSVTVADLNGDGKLDLVAGSGGFFSVFLGNGNATFQVRTDFPAPLSPHPGITTADFNGDGRLDVALSYPQGNTAWVFLQSAGAALSNASLTFGNQELGTTSSTQTLTLTSNGSFPLNINAVGIVGTNPGDFSETDNCVSASPITSGGTCEISVSFHPGAVGSRSATLQITSDAGESPQMVTLSGIGVVTTQPPAITSPSSTTFTLGQPGAFTVTATGTPAPTISESGALAGGVTFNAATHSLSGTPTTAGTFNITFTASNGAGANAVQSFALTVRLPSVSSLSLAPTSVQGGIVNSIGTITLNAPAAGTTTQRRVTLASSNTAAATVPAGLTIATGATTATFTVTSLTVGTSTTSNILATLNGGTQSAVLSVVPAAAVTSIVLNPASVVGGSANSTGTVTLTSPATGTTAQRRVTLTSSNTAAATVPANVTVAIGATTATFTVTSHAVTAVANAAITGTLNRSTTTILTVNPLAPASLALNPASVLGGIANSVGTVILAAPAAGTTAQRTVSLASDNAAAATVPASVTIPTGATSANFTVTSHTVAVASIANISATLNSVARSAALSVLPPPGVASLTLSPTSVVGGSSNSTATVTLTAPAAGSAAQRRVTLSSSNTAAATAPANITIAAGATTATFVVTSKVVAAANSAIITATLNGSAAATLAVTPLQMTNISVNPTSVKGGVSNATGTVTLNAAAQGTTAQRTVRLSSSNTSAATVPATVTIAAGATSVGFTITSRRVTTAAAVNISATLNGGTKTAALTVTP